MADQPGSSTTNIIVDLSIESFQDTVRADVNDQTEAVLEDLEATYHSRRLNNPQVHGVRVSVNINYSIRLLDTRADLNEEIARRSYADMAQEIARVDSDIGSSDAETDTEDHSDEEAPPTPLSSAARLLVYLPIVNLAELPEDSQHCPVCQEHFPGTDLTEADMPILLHCNHIVGRACIERWMAGNHNSCPICRAAIFEPAVLTALANREELVGHLGPFWHVDGNFAGDDSEEGVGAEHLGSHAAIETLPETEVLPALADEERLEAGDSGQRVTDDYEVEREILALERQAVGHYDRMTQLQASPPEEEALAATSALVRDVREFNARIATLRVRVRMRR